MQKSNIIRELKWSTISVLSRYVFQTLSIVVMARLLNPEDFGYITSQTIIIAIGTIIVQMGSVQIISVAKNNKIYNILVASLMINVAKFFLLLILVVLISFYTDWKVNVWVVLILFSRTIYASFEGFFINKGKLEKLGLIDCITNGVFGFLVPVTLMYIGLDVGYVIVTMAFQAISQTIIICFYSRNIIKTYNVDFNLLIDLFSKMSYVFLSQIINSIASQADNIIIAKFFNSSELGLYSRAFQIIIVPINFIGMIIQRVFLRNFSDGYEKKHLSILKRSIFISSLLSNAIILCFVFYSPKIIKIILGDGWDQVSELLIILSFTVFNKLITKLSEPILIARNKLRNLVGYGIINLLVFFIVVILFFDFGLKGIALAIYASTFAYSLLCMCWLIKFYSELKLILSITTLINMGLVFFNIKYLSIL